MRELLAIFIFIPFFSFGQKQGNIWYFGEGLGLDFNGGTPVVLTNGKINQVPLGNAYLSEGASSIADSSGNLLFYSNGEYVWNKNHQAMPNGAGLLGHHSSTHSAFILPKPQNDSIFYLFTTDAFQNNLANGLRYNEINMCSDSGLGDIAVGKKNLLLLDMVTEKLAATQHANGTDYWLITHKYFSNSFYSFRISANGISDTVISNIGSVHDSNPSGNTISALGQIKISPNGQKVALSISNHSPPIVELFDFNNSSGVISNLINLTVTSSSPEVYGVSFSSNSSKLYVNGAIGLHQFDLNAGGGYPDSVRNSRIQIPYSPFSLGGALQLGPDNKIYVIRPLYNYLGVINNPNAQGLACNFTDNAINLAGKQAKGSFPNFIDNFNYNNTIPTCGMPCPPMSLTYSITDATPGLHDGAVKINVSGGNSPYHYSLDSISFQSSSTFTSLDTGAYYVYVTDNNGCTSQGTFTVTYDTTVNTQSINNFNPVRVFPNPFSDELFIELSKQTDINIKLIDVLGRVILASQHKNTSTIKLNVTQIPQGVYYLELRNNKGEKLHTTHVQIKAGVKIVN